ncbi:splicing factor 45 [Microplitis demolitor]|uniref:splicing factor 45 n=1 Tax=Microplitis demolitor TaxID=69319 RepID=UPI0004400095|nr:splicing factor 45 [Microplitis demolitor]
MSLYDDFDKHRASDKVAGWSSGIKLLQSQLQLKKAAVTQPKREQFRKATAVLPPVIDLKSKASSRDAAAAAAAAAERDEEGSSSLILSSNNTFTNPGINTATTGEYDWNVINEYDPLWPNEYEKVVKELRDIRDREYEQEAEQRKRRREISRFEEQTIMANTMVVPERDEERTSTSRGIIGGAAIAPPPSLQEPSEITMPSISTPTRPVTTPGLGYTTSSVAAKIMAKYGFKEGQGLGKKEQGMSVALQVEKTSKRGGRIVGEKEQLMPPPLAVSSSPPSNTQSNEEPTITEIMKSPSKVVLLRNMVGPGEVDEDLEPEVKDECNTKYGDVARVLIHEVMDVVPEEAVRIFVEFKRIESAIKAVVDLNGRFFGGRQVRAGFYSSEKLDNLQLMD